VIASQRTRVAAYAVCTDDAGRILLCRVAPSVAPGEIWTLPGGGLDFGEPPEVAVLRELDEEAGYTGEVVTLVDVSDRILTDTEEVGVLHAIRIVYYVRITGGELRDEIGGSTDTCGWFSSDEASHLNLGELARNALIRIAAADQAPDIALDTPHDPRSRT
jgi:ADP-ribose pyrophosphatase YjhB (NUDIX family)